MQLVSCFLLLFLYRFVQVCFISLRENLNDNFFVQVKWINKQRVLVFATRGINHRHRHLMEDLKRLMPHHRPESKMERTKNLQVVNEMCEIKNCNKAILFEGRMKRDLYVWFANVPAGPSAKFLVENSMYNLLFKLLKYI